MKASGKICSLAAELPPELIVDEECRCEAVEADSAALPNSALLL
jgi:hypothetical protein